MQGQVEIHTDDTIVEFDECPFIEANYGQEEFIMSCFWHYRNQHLVFQILETPHWLQEAINLVAFWVNEDDEAARLRRR